MSTRKSKRKARRALAQILASTASTLQKTTYVLWAADPEATYSSVAQTLGVPIGVVKSRIHRARLHTKKPEELPEDLKEVLGAEPSAEEVDFDSGIRSELASGYRSWLQLRASVRKLVPEGSFTIPMNGRSHEHGASVALMTARQEGFEVSSRYFEATDTLFVTRAQQ